MDTYLVGALRQRGVPIITPVEENLMGRTDEEQLLFALRRGCVLYTFNVSDFYALHTELVGNGEAPCRADSCTSTALLRGRTTPPNYAVAGGKVGRGYARLRCLSKQVGLIVPGKRRIAPRRPNPVQIVPETEPRSLSSHKRGAPARAVWQLIRLRSRSRVVHPGRKNSTHKSGRSTNLSCRRRAAGIFRLPSVAGLPP